jgi:hypothetical protein
MFRLQFFVKKDLTTDTPFSLTEIWQATLCLELPAILIIFILNRLSVKNCTA